MEPRARIELAQEHRRSVNLLQRPLLQLKLPIYLLLITAGFGALWARHAATAFDEFYQTLAVHQPAYLEALLDEQVRDFAVVSGILAVVYVLVLLAVSIVYLHRIVGPTVPLRRQLESLKNGDYASRVHLRSRDAFQDLASDLNELAELLEQREKQS